MSRLRVVVVESVRTDQAEPVPRPQHSTCEGLYRPASRRFDRLEGSQAHSLRSEARKYSSEIVSRLALWSNRLLELS
jgi:hypothetical protein